MRDMEQTPQKMTLRYQLAAIGRDAITITTVVGLLLAGFGFLTRPYTQPFLDLPMQVSQLQLQLAQTQLELAEIREPHIVDFKGHGIIIGPREIFSGQTIKILYNLRRNASCVTDLEVGYINVNDGTRLVTHTTRATQAPVTKDFAVFLLRHSVQDLPPGTWSYQPRLIPVDCGVYGPYNGAMTEPFTVKERR
jgi:hypothetical protein